MAQLICTLTVETDLMGDVIDSLERVCRALPKRHGAEFRRLDRRISAIMEGGRAISPPTVQYLGGGRLVVIPPKELCDVVNAAHALGVI